MTREEIIKQVQEDAGEWLEMIDNPNDHLVGILANKIIKLEDHINYLEKRLEYVNITTNLRA